MIIKDKSFCQIEIFIFFIATIAASTIYFSRIGFTNDISIILKSLLLVFIVIFLPAIIIKDKEFFFLKPIISFIIIVLLILYGFTKIIYQFDISFFFYFFGFLLFIYFSIFIFFTKKITYKNIFFLLICSFFSIFIVSAYYGNDYTHPLMMEKIMNGSWAHRDIVFHSSISGMFKTYLYGGTGVDGFVPHYYHKLSHFIIATFSEILNTNTLIFYSIVYPILIIPFFFLFFIYSAIEASKYFSFKERFKKTSEKDNITWFIVFIFFALPFNRYYLSEHYQYIQSQTYTIGLLLLFFIINLIFIYIKINNSKNNIKINLFNIKISDLLIFFILFLCVSACYAKISVSYVITIFSFYFFIRLKLFKTKLYWCVILVWICFLLYFYFSLLRNFGGRDLFDREADVENYTFTDEFFYSYISIFFIIMKIFSLKIFTIKKLINSIKNMEILDIEFLSILMIALYFTPFQYFKGIQLYIAYIFIIANLNLFKNLIFNQYIDDKK